MKELERQQKEVTEAGRGVGGLRLALSLRCARTMKSEHLLPSLCPLYHSCLERVCVPLWFVPGWPGVCIAWMPGMLAQPGGLRGSL